MAFEEDRTPATKPRPDPITFELQGHLYRGDLEGLCRRLEGFLIDHEARSVACDLRSLVDPDATAVDALARLHLAAARLGCRLLLRNASLEMHELLAFAGLEDVIESEAPGLPEV